MQLLSIPHLEVISVNINYSLASGFQIKLEEMYQAFITYAMLQMQIHLYHHWYIYCAICFKQFASYFQETFVL